MSEENGIKDLLGLEKPLTKLVECVSAGIGKVYEPIHIKRMAKAKKEEITVIGEILAENINLPTKYDDGKITIDTSEVEELIKRTGNRVLYIEFRKQQNIESVIAETYNLLEEEKSVSQEAINQDWLYKFFDEVGEISDEYMQKIWAKILAGEIKRPKSYTLRTLNTLKNITTDEALLFNKLIPFIIFHHKEPMIYRNERLLNKYDIIYDELLQLEDCGLINLNGFVTYRIKDDILFNYQTILIVKDKLEFNVYTLTESGKQIINLLRANTKFNDKYFLDVCNEIKSLNRNIQMNAYKINNIDESGFNYDTKNDLLPKTEEIITT